jgi:hypothetical protein
MGSPLEVEVILRTKHKVKNSIAAARAIFTMDGA